MISSAHSPDNSFMGFVVDRVLNDNITEKDAEPQRDIALVYGKNDYMWEVRLLGDFILLCEISKY